MQANMICMQATISVGVYLYVFTSSVSAFMLRYIHH
jgi:hypothetical protein